MSRLWGRPSLMYYLLHLQFLSASWGGMGPSSLLSWTNEWSVVPPPDDDEWWLRGNRWNAWQGNRRTGRKPASVPLCPPKIPPDLTQARTRDAAVESRRRTVWAMARPMPIITTSVTNHENHAILGYVKFSWPSLSCLQDSTPWNPADCYQRLRGTL